MKTCMTCNKELELTEFYNKDTRRCKKCHHLEKTCNVCFKELKITEFYQPNHGRCKKCHNVRRKNCKSYIESKTGYPHKSKYDVNVIQTQLDQGIPRKTICANLGMPYCTLSDYVSTGRVVVPPKTVKVEEEIPDIPQYLLDYIEELLIETINGVE